MSSAPTQFALDIRFRRDQSFATYIAAQTPDVARLLRQHLEQRDEPLLLLWGGPGTGKSHLLQASCQHAIGLRREVSYVDLAQAQRFGPQALKGFDHCALICLDNLPAICGHSAWEEELFHAFNQWRASGVQLLLSARSEPHTLPIKLPDLHSRLQWGLSLRLTPLADEQKVEALLVQAQQRGLGLAPQVAQYLLNHYQRDLSALQNLLDELDQAGLVAQRRLTLPFIRDYLAQQGPH